MGIILLPACDKGSLMLNLSLRNYFFLSLKIDYSKILTVVLFKIMNAGRVER